MLRKKPKAAQGAPHSSPGSTLPEASPPTDVHLPGESKKRYGNPDSAQEAVFASHPDGVATFDRNFHYKSANPAYTQAAGVPFEKLARRSHFELFPDPRVEDVFRQVLATGQPHQATAEALPFLQQPGQDPRYCDWSLYRWGIDGGSQNGLILLLHRSDSGTLQARDARADESQKETRTESVEKSESSAPEIDDRVEASEAQARASRTQLRLTQLMYQHLFETTPDSNVIVNEAGEIVATNHQAEILFGYQRGELSGQKVEVIIPAVQRELHALKNAEYLRSPATHVPPAEKALRQELIAHRKNRTTFLTETTFSPVKIGKSLLILCVVRDISQRVQREKELRTQTALVRLLQDIAVAANETTTVHTAFKYALERINQHIGWRLGHAYITGEDGVLTTIPIWIETGVRHTPPSISTEDQRYAEDLPTSSSPEAPPDPGRSPGAVSYESADDSGLAQHPFALFRAVSDALRLRAGEGLPGVALSSGQPVWLNDLPDNPQFARRREARLEGLKTGLAVPVMVGKEAVAILEFFHDEEVLPDPNLMAVLPNIGVQLGRVVERSRAEESLRRTAAQLRMVITSLPVTLWVIDREGQLIMREGRGVSTTQVQTEALVGKNIFEQFAIRPDFLGPIRQALTGKEVHTELLWEKDLAIEVFMTPYYDAEGKVDGVIGLAFNINERKRMESELEEMKHRLLDSMDNQRVRLAAQLHDGPLQDLYGAYYQIQEIRTGLEGCSQQTADSALQIIQGVNATLRVICGELHPNTLVHLGLEKAIRSHAERMQERLDGIVIHLELDNDGQSLSYELRRGIYLIYQQLFANAARHSEAKDIWVQLRLEPKQIMLEVQDNGRGFENPPHWIELVRQGKLGLASAQERVERLNGTLEIDTHPGQGTLARMIVPQDE